MKERRIFQWVVVKQIIENCYLPVSHANRVEMRVFSKRSEEQFAGSDRQAVVAIDVSFLCYDLAHLPIAVRGILQFHEISVKIKVEQGEKLLLLLIESVDRVDIVRK